MTKPTDYLLVRCRTLHGDRLAVEAGAWCADAGLTLDRAARQPETGQTYLYARLLEGRRMSAAELEAIARAWSVQVPSASEPQLCRLELVSEARGHSHGATPVVHYAVEMDPEAGWREELERWYDTEHLPGLAAVPGTIHAQRLLNHDAGPLSLARYDLVSADTMGSPPWLAVRGTAWSDRARPHFTNTRRTMFVCLA